MALPPLPAENEDPWFSKRKAFDDAVRGRLDGDLSPTALSTTYASIDSVESVSSIVETGRLSETQLEATYASIDSVESVSSIVETGRLSETQLEATYADKTTQATVETGRLSVSNLNTTYADKTTQATVETGRLSETQLNATYADKTTQATVETGRLSETQLNATIVERVEEQIAAQSVEQLNAVAAIQRETSTADARYAWETNDGFAEQWADTDDWYTAGWQVSGGVLYRATVPDVPNWPYAGIGVRPLPIGDGNGRIKASFVIPPVLPSMQSVALIGFWWGNDATSKPTELGADGGAYMFGFRNYTAMYRSPAGALEPIGDELAPGTYYLTGVMDESDVSFSLENADGTALRTVQEPRISGQNPTGIAIMQSDERHINGIGIGPVSARVGTVTSLDRNRIEGIAPSLHLTTTPASVRQDTRFYLPRDHDSRRPVPLILYSHTSGGGATDPWIGSPGDGGPFELTKALIDAGFALASNNQHGNNWGNQAAVTDLVETYNLFRSLYPLGPVAILCQSMGGVAALNTIARREVPGIRGFYGIFPACNLTDMYAEGSGAYASAIQTAYGFSEAAGFDAATEGYDPLDREGWEFQGIRYRFHHSAADTVVGKAENSDMIAAKVAPYALESTVVATSGNHGDASNFDGADAVAFFRRCFGQ